MSTEGREKEEKKSRKRWKIRRSDREKGGK
jgi:hypothetical protein